jgi:hypothetical protein
MQQEHAPNWSVDIARLHDGMHELHVHITIFRPFVNREGMNNAIELL